MTKDTNQPPELDQPTAYQIKVQGRLDESWSGWFNGMTITFESGSDGSSITTLTGPVLDQAALRGVLSKIWDLNLTLISVTRIQMHQIEMDSGKEKNRACDVIRAFNELTAEGQFISNGSPGKTVCGESKEQRIGSGLARSARQNPINPVNPCSYPQKSQESLINERRLS
jgi:hypothetical protein